MKTPRTTTAKPPTDTTSTDEDHAMTTSRTPMTIERVKQLKGDELLQAHEQVLGAAAKPKTPVPVLRARIIAALERRAAEAATETPAPIEATPVEPAPAGPAPIDAHSATEGTPVAAPATTTADAPADANVANTGATGDAPAVVGATAAGAPEAERQLPPVGTKIEKKDRHGNVRASCTVVDGGVDYAGKVYKSLSAAAMAAAKDLGLNAKRLNGWAWFGLDDAPRAERTTPAKPIDFDGIERAWDRYRERVEAAAQRAIGDERARLQQRLAAHARALTNLPIAGAQPNSSTEAA